MTGVGAGWRSCTKATGAPCVTTTGIPRTQMSSVGSLAVATQCRPWEAPTLVRAQGTSSWAPCTAQEGSPTCLTAPTAGGTTMNVDTKRTLESCAQVMQTSPQIATCATLGTAAPAVSNTAARARPAPQFVCAALSVSSVLSERGHRCPLTGRAAGSERCLLSRSPQAGRFPPQPPPAAPQ